MNIKKIIGTSMIALLVVALSVGMAAACTIDGDLTDWGVTVDDGGDWSLEATWVPVGHDNVQFQIEDNVDPDSATSWDGDSRAAYATGVHITGTARSYGIYDEARVSSGHHAGWAFPTGDSGASAEKYDMEAMYVNDTDSDNLYFAIVLSCNANAYSGDLGIDLTSVDSDDGYAYEYGVTIHDNAGTYTARNRSIVDVSDWSECTVVPDSSPARIMSGSSVGTATVAYVKNGPDPEPYTGYPATYIIEGKIPRSDIGNPIPGSVPLGNWHYTVLCGNDGIPIPEFGVLAVPVIALMGLVFFMRRKKE